MIEVLDRREQIEPFLRHDPALHIYELGDLDPFFWPQTRWFGLRRRPGAPLDALALVYDGAHTPTLLALAREHDAALAELLAGIAERLPDSLYAHLGPGLGPVLEREGYVTESRAEHLKLVLPGAALASLEPPPAPVEVLGPGDLDALLALYARSYPGNWFNPRMVETGQYVGIRGDDPAKLIAVAGIHVYSPAYRVAALGNVTTDPACRGQGLARAVVAGLCVQLRRTVEVIGLNVSADNAAALACYTRLGFARLAPYQERALSRPRGLTPC